MISIRERIGVRAGSLVDKRNLVGFCLEVETTIVREEKQKSIRAGMVRWAKARGDINYP